MNGQALGRCHIMDKNVLVEMRMPFLYFERSSLFGTDAERLLALKED